MSGDVLLNPITPHPDDLLAYLRTLEELSHYNDIVLVLPGHGELIRDLAARIRFPSGTSSKTFGTHVRELNYRKMCMGYCNYGRLFRCISKSS